MMRPRTRRLLLPVPSLALAVQVACTYGMLWRWYNAAGMKAYQEGRCAEAESHWTAVLKEAEESGEQDPRLAKSLNNLALLYKAQGKCTQAERLYQRAIAIDEKALGPEHPSVAQSLNNMAAIYSAEGQYAQAGTLYQRALAIAEKALVPQHPNVAKMLENYAELLRKMDRDAEAGKMDARAQAIRTKRAEGDPTK